MKDFEDIEAWQDAQDLAIGDYNNPSKVKDYSLCDQIKRAVELFRNYTRSRTDARMARDRYNVSSMTITEVMDR